MLRAILKLFGYRMGYVCEWGWYWHRYDACDYYFSRPIHRDMSVAPPWAKLKIERSRPSKPIEPRIWLCLGGHEWTGHHSSCCPVCGRRPSTEKP